MRIILSESQFKNVFLQEVSNDLYSAYSGKITSAENSLDSVLKSSGNIMMNIRNGKDYLVYYDKSLSNAIGKNYCICRLVKDGQPFGSIRVEPMDLFKRKNSY